MNQLRRHIALFAFALTGILAALGQGLNVTVNPVRNVLPPQVMYYISNPGQYFNISIQNTSNEVQQVYFGVELRQITPSADIEIVVPGKTLPQTPYIIPASGTKVLNAAEMRTMFNHVRMEDISIPANLFDNAISGSFGNLPEGTYEIKLMAYKWDPHISSSVLLNNPALSRTIFTVCYQAKAPEWIMPVAVGDFEDKNIATLSKQTPMLSWTAPVVNCDPRPRTYTYDIRIVQQLPMQAVDEAIDRNPVVYQTSGLQMPQCLLPLTVINNLSPNETYLARITAKSNATQVGSLDYINITNAGKSDIKMFRLKDYSVLPDVPSVDSVKQTETPTDSAEIISFGGVQLTDSLYNFINPEIIVPRYLPEDGARKEFINSDIAVTWRRPAFEGGSGTDPDTVKFTYDVELFSSSDYVAKEEMVQRDPVYTNRGLEVLTDTIHWKDLEEKVSKGDYLLLRIKPTAVNEQSIAFLNDSINVVDFAMSEIFTNRYFQCANQVEITNEKPTSASAEDLKGKSVTIGEYELVLDGQIEAVKDKAGHFKGTGHVIWEPLLLTWKLAVKFDDIAINTDNQVYEGLVQTYDGGTNKMKSSEVVEKLFSDWGIDNLIGDTGIPYADKLQSTVNDKIKGLADQLPIGEYYQDYLDGKAKVLGLLEGNVENVTFPLEIPEKINPTPVNLTISTMKFAPTYATMDIFGTFVVPETKATQGQILVFGAPRLCISPKSLIPEGGTVALLKDFEVVDPKTDFKCKFLAPKDVVTPEDGCFVSWSENKFEWLNIDMDMTMPSDLKKVVAGKATNESPKLHLSAKIQEWEHFIAEGSLDAFEHVDLPGYVFTANTCIVDLAANSNHKNMGAFPTGYKLEKAGLSKGTVNEWTGLYFKELSMSFPSSIKIGNGEEPMKVSVSNLFIDKSGVTLDCGVVNAINYSKGENGTIGGFKVTLDNIFVSVVQNSFNKFGFNGKLQIPLFKGEITYACDIYNQTFTGKGGGKGYAYVFKTSQIEDLNFDFMLGDLTLDKDLTYFLVEAIDDGESKTKTNVELCLGGSVEIAGTDVVNKKAAKLPFDLKLPAIKFCKMRIANNDGFESVYESDMQKKSKDAIEAVQAEVESSKALGAGWWNEGKPLLSLGTGSKLYLNFGQWGLASPEKKIGPFTFTLKDWGFDLNKSAARPYVAIKLGGDITFCKELDIKAGTTIEIQSYVDNLDDITNISIEYKAIEFQEARFNFDAKVLKFDGTLTIDGNSGNAIGDKGYKGSLGLTVAGGLFEMKVKGGYYDHKEEGNNYSWGFFKAEVGGKAGIPLGPISLTDINGGVYINCVYNKSDELSPKPKKGAIGILFGMGISTADQVTMKGDLNLTVAYDSKIKRLTSFIFTGGVKCAGGIVDSKVKMVYENTDTEQYFQLDVTVDASLDGGLNEFLGEWSSNIEKAYGEAESAFKSALGDSNDKKNYKANMDAYEAKKAKDKNKQDDGVSAKGPSLKVSLDIYIGHKKTNGVAGPTKWHVYLGQPDADKRCEFILVNFKSKIVSVSVGANAYLCIGNELPNNGKLPEIPEKVRTFLNGGEKAGVKSDNLSDATYARRKAYNQFMADAESDGGVMLGASVWGYVDVNLGLFYGDMGLTAGFDISVRHLKSQMNCVNLNKTPGYKGWYGEGQLYAYLYAKFGLDINLGFFNKKVDLLDAGIGGVLKCAMPNPNYFTGKARVKVKMLGGLVNVNKTFSFECGDVCEMFYGNALDDYKLFDRCNIGCDSWEQAVDNKIDWEIQQEPTVYTQAELESPIRVMDPTEMQRLQSGASSDGTSEAAFKDMASRQFKFSLHPSVVPTITEYGSLNDAKRDRNGRVMEIKHIRRNEKLVFDVAALRPNKYYRLRVAGRALEFYKGSWNHPEKYDTYKKKYVATPWTQWKDFYFVTNDKKAELLDDAEDLQKHVKVAFPNYADPKRIIWEQQNAFYVLPQDVKRPVISLAKQLKSSCYRKGTLKWVVGNNGKYIDECNNLWIENDSVSVMTPVRDLKTASGLHGILLKYEWTEYKTTKATWNAIRTYTVYGNSLKEVQEKEQRNAVKEYKLQIKNIRVQVAQQTYLDARETSVNQVGSLRFKVTIYKFGSGIVTIKHVKDLARMFVYPDNGYKKADDVFDNPPYYCSKFIATRLDHMDGPLLAPYTDEYYLGDYKSKGRWLNGYYSGGQIYYVTNDPFAYSSYLGNMFFVGGAKFSSGGKDLNYSNMSTESMSLSMPYGNWKNGLLNMSQTYLINNGAVNINQRMIYNLYRWNKDFQSIYPLFTIPGTAVYDQHLGTHYKGMFNYHKLTEKNFAMVLADLYSACYNAANGITSLTNNQILYKKKHMRDWLSTHKYGYNNYKGANGSGVALKVPQYQFGVIYAAANLDGVNINKTIEIGNGVKRHARIDKDYAVGRRLYYSTVKSEVGKAAMDKNYKSGYKYIGFDATTIAKRNKWNLKFTRYRVNAWNFKERRWTVCNDSRLGTASSYFTKTYWKTLSELVSKYKLSLTVP